MPTPNTAIALFLSLGLGGVLASSALEPAALAQNHDGHHRAQTQTSEPSEGGEGGEGGESGNAGPMSAVQSDADLLLALAQMQGHLLIATELLNRGENAAAEPHVGHPADELYGAVAPALTQRGIPPFLEVLEALRQQVRLDPRSSATTNRLAAARQAIERAELALPAAFRNAPSTLPMLVRQLAATASQEYGAAVDDGRVIELIEYQDARGFLLEAQRRLGMAPTPQPAAIAALKAMLKSLPTSPPPGRILISPDQLQELQAQL